MGVLDQVTKSQGTRRFAAFCLTLIALTGVALILGGLDKSPELLDATLWPIAMFGAGYVASGMAHDGFVRGTVAKVMGSLRGTPPEPQKTDG